jgi:type II pantothenate kinase
MKDLDGVTAFAVDIGGSLAKLAYYAVHRHVRTSFRDAKGSNEGPCPLYSAEHEEEEMGRLHFAVFETKHIGSCLDFINAKLKDGGVSAEFPHYVNATGGGAHKFAQLFHDKLSLRFRRDALILTDTV